MSIKLISLIAIIPSVLFSQQLQITPVPPATIKSLQYREFLKAKKSKLIVFMPAKYVKATLKVGMNRANVRTFATSIAQNIESKEATSEIMDDIEANDLTALVGYDFRIKFYIAKNYRIILRTQSFVSSSTVTNKSIGFIWKIQYGKFKQTPHFI